MKLKLISCEVLARVAYHFAAVSPNIIDIELLSRGLHENPANLRSLLQAKIDLLESENFDAILLGYGLCGKSTDGLKAGKHKLVIPRAHDCITLFLGSRDLYQQQFEQCPGTYWFVQDYMERTSENNLKGIGSFFDLETERKYDEFVQKYGKENADFLRETFSSWQSHYTRAGFIDQGLDSNSKTEHQAKEVAMHHSWLFEKFIADLILVRKLLDGDWDDDFLQVKPGRMIKMTFSNDIFKSESI